jgi:hypothetical protein
MKKSYYLTLFIVAVMPVICLAQDPGGTPGATGTVTGNYRGSAVTYTTVRAKDGWVWLKQNVGSSHVAASSTDAGSYGDLFQWGRWDDGHQVRNPGNVVDGMPTPNNPSGLNLSGDNPFYKGGGITWYNDGTVNDKWNAATPAAATATNGCDPCRQIFGSGWQMPSLADWQAVLAAEGTNNLATGFASNLKLPAAGARNELLGSLGDEGVIGIYWSSTAEAGSAPQAMYINLYTSNLADYNYRGIGMPIRCLKKSLPTSIKENKTGSTIKLYPNPAQNYVSLDMNTTAPDIDVHISNVLGSVVLTQKVNNKLQPIFIAVNDLTDGVYFLHLSDGRFSEVKQFVVKH